MPCERPPEHAACRLPVVGQGTCRQQVRVQQCRAPFFSPGRAEAEDGLDGNKRLKEASC